MNGGTSSSPPSTCRRQRAWTSACRRSCCSSTARRPPPTSGDQRRHRGAAVGGGAQAHHHRRGRYRDEGASIWRSPCCSLDAARRRPRLTRLVELIHRAVPYPVVLSPSRASALDLSLAHKRWSQGEAGKTVLDGDVVAAECGRGARRRCDGPRSVMRWRLAGSRAQRSSRSIRAGSTRCSRCRRPG